MALFFVPTLIFSKSQTFCVTNCPPCRLMKETSFSTADRRYCYGIPHLISFIIVLVTLLLILQLQKAVGDFRSDWQSNDLITQKKLKFLHEELEANQKTEPEEETTPSLKTSADRPESTEKKAESLGDLMDSLEEKKQSERQPTEAEEPIFESDSVSQGSQTNQPVTPASSRAAQRPSDVKSAGPLPKSIARLERNRVPASRANLNKPLRMS